MSSSLTIEESKLGRFLTRLEESVFTVIYNLQKTRPKDLTRVNWLNGLASILLDFIQILPFLVHGNINFINACKTKVSTLI
jgi:hypothetical protein